jgi:hypothetical protein
MSQFEAIRRLLRPGVNELERRCGADVETREAALTAAKQRLGVS